MNNVVPHIPLCIREENAMQTGRDFCCLVIGRLFVKLSVNYSVLCMMLQFCFCMKAIFFLFLISLIFLINF